MGLKDRLGAAKRWMWSPLGVDLLERGSDAVVHAGRRAKVVVEVSGENDGTAERIEVQLALNIGTTWPLGEVPTAIGRHELDVQIPEDLPPSSRYTEYRFVGKLHRRKGTGSEGVSPVDVIGDPAHLYWPEGPRAESDDPALAVEFDADTVAIGGTLSGRMRAPAGAKVKVEAGPVVDAFVHVEGRSKGVQKADFKKVLELDLDAAGTFRAEIPAGVPPTLYDGDKTWVVWEVRATVAKQTARHRFGVLDPDGLGVGDRRSASPGLLDLFT